MKNIVKKKAMYKSIVLLFVLFCLIGQYNKVSAVKNAIVEKNLILIKDESYELTADLDYEDEMEYYWESKNPEIAEVDADTGVVKAIAKGKTTVELYVDEEIVGTCTVRVEIPSLNVKKKTVEITDTFQLTVGKTEQEVSYHSAKSSIAKVSADGVVTAVSAGSTKITATLFNKTTNTKTKYTCTVKVKNTKLIALTFDDGPSIYTPIVLDALEKNQAKATFFVVGSRITDKTKGHIKRAEELGCEIGNHTYSHINMSSSSLEKIQSEIKKTDKKVKSIIGSPTYIMRPPYGSLTEKTQKNIDKAMVFWNVDTLDWKYRNTDYVINYVLANAKDGDIVLMHDLYKSTANAVDTIIRGLQEKGFKVVTVSELAQAKGKELVSGKKYYSFKKS
ncbi:polysaccharide deacetylase family protein [Anaerosporobacter faecicola]|uniref:polysaccharide deacetylase family protein n=1 Tax=Anaerosporobacter faecicola TaxID=2718714 RepID=UPI001439DF7E|nr:polysaccharide deacetylase family protein [Anaerosporobacter faecicola]